MKKRHTSLARPRQSSSQVEVGRRRRRGCGQAWEWQGGGLPTRCGAGATVKGVANQASLLLELELSQVIAFLSLF